MTEAPDQFQTLMSRLRDDPALANLLRPDAAVLVWDEAAERLLWASPPAADFAAGLLDESGRLNPGSRARQRLEALASGLAPHVGVRLERLLLDPARLSPPVTCACRLAALPSGTKVLVTVIVGALPKARRAAPPQEAAAAPVEAEKPPLVRSGGSIRFVWQADPQTRFIHVSSGLAEAVGPMAGDILGRTWAEISRLVVEDSGDIAGLFARQETWSGRTIAWRVDNKSGTVPVAWAGMPIFGSDRELVGFRGFGLIPKDALAELPDATEALRPEEGGPAAVEASEPEIITPDEPEEVIEVEPSSPVVAEIVQQGDVHAPERESERDLTDEEKLFEQLRETVAASLSEPTIEIYQHVPEEEEEEEAEPEPEPPVVLRPPEPQSGLSNTERNAFREIARALGARFEPETPPAAEERTHERVPPFRRLALVPDPVADPEEEDADTPAVAPASPASEGPPGTPEAVEDTAEEPTHTSVANAEAPPIALAAEAPADEGRVGPHPATDGQALLAQLPMPALVHQGEHIVFANRALLALTGYDDREHLAAGGGLPRLFGANPIASADCATLTTRQRESVSVELRQAPVLWDGIDADLLLVRRLPDGDTSQRLRRVETELGARDVRIHELESVLDTATDGVIVLDETGRILSLNRTAEALFGYNQSDVVGDAITVLLSPESHIVALDYLEGLRSPGVASLLNDGREVLGRVRQGGSIPLFMTMGQINDGPNRKLCAVLRDITPFKKAEGELVGARRAAEQANAQKSDLLAKISHEIRTPLNAILGFAEVMLEERFGPIGNDRYKEYLKDVHASGAHVISLVNDLLDLAKVEAGRMDLSFTSVNLNDLVSSCFTLLQPQAARDRIVMRTSFAAKLPPVVADDRSVRQIVLNLVSNAIKFTDAGGQVIVSTALTDRGEVAFRVRDTGIGMNSEEVEAALEPFRQLATSRKRGGTGLGLPLTKALVEANRGALQISSQPNEGTLVEVIFPPTRVLAE